MKPHTVHTKFIQRFVHIWFIGSDLKSWTDLEIKIEWVWTRSRILRESWGAKLKLKKTPLTCPHLHPWAGAYHSLLRLSGSTVLKPINLLDDFFDHWSHISPQNKFTLSEWEMLWRSVNYTEIFITTRYILFFSHRFGCM